MSEPGRWRCAIREGRGAYKFSDWTTRDQAAAAVYLQAALWVREGYVVQREGQREKVIARQPKIKGWSATAEVVADD